MSNDDDYRSFLLKERGFRYGCDDQGNKARFVDMHKSKLKYLNEEKRWVQWTGIQWKSDDIRLYEKAEEVARSLLDEAKTLKNDTARRELVLWGDKLFNKGRIDPMLKLAAEELGVSISEFDKNPDIINCEDGIVDLHDATLRPHSPNDLVMKAVNCRFDPHASRQRWQQFLNEVFQNDEALIEYVQRALGYTLTGHVREHVLFIAYGTGSNGKTVLFETILGLLGDYGRATEFSSFLATDKSDLRSQEAVGALRGIRFGLASETDSTRKFNEALLKRLTGGDTLIGAKLYGSSYEFKPSHKLWFLVNHLPGVKDASHGFWRRPVIIPFNAQFDGDQRDPELMQSLAAERDGIFQWLLEGAEKYYESGLGKVPQICKEALEEYRSDNDFLSRFIVEKMEEDKEAALGMQEAFDAYQDWCAENKEPPPLMKFFAAGLAERGIHKKRMSKGQVFPGYKLRHGSLGSREAKIDFERFTGKIEPELARDVPGKHERQERKTIQAMSYSEYSKLSDDEQAHILGMDWARLGRAGPSQMR